MKYRNNNYTYDGDILFWFRRTVSDRWQQIINKYITEDGLSMVVPYFLRFKERKYFLTIYSSYDKHQKSFKKFNNYLSYCLWLVELILKNVYYYVILFFKNNIKGKVKAGLHVKKPFLGFLGIIIENPPSSSWNL